MESPVRFAEYGRVFSRSRLDLDPTQRSALGRRNLKIAARPRNAYRRRLVEGSRGETDRFDLFSTDIGNRPDSTKVPRRPKSRLRFVRQRNRYRMSRPYPLCRAADDRIYVAREQVLFLPIARKRAGLYGLESLIPGLLRYMDRGRAFPRCSRVSRSPRIERLQLRHGRKFKPGKSFQVYRS